MKVVNLSNEQVIVEHLMEAHNFFKRLRGLMFTARLDSGKGLHIKPCRSIHTFFMNYPIDVLYVNDHNIIVAIEESVAPGKVGKLYADASSVVELPAGTVKETGTEVGNSLSFN
ncbi:DUF192 domain-containing protein [Bacillus sp. SCS-153A]|uniref:DUF192 domain-containing protein n=1 Tax=Rossellomorea sedimentorum TaxID=3115294 RepID=UPI003906987C